MSKSESADLWKRWTLSHSQFPVPVFALATSGDIFWRNIEAERLMPFVRDWSTLSSLIPGLDPPGLFARLESGPVSLPGDILAPATQIHIIAGPVPGSLAAYLLKIQGMDGVPALMTSFSGNSRRWLADIFATIDAAALRSTLMEDSWDLASLQRISANSYKLLRDMTNFTEYMRFLKQEYLPAQFFELCEFLENRKTIVCAIAKERDVEVEYKLPSRCVFLEANLERLDLAITNLLSNAIRFSPMGGKVTLTLERHDAHCSILIQDQGPGIPKENLEKIFDAGFSYHPSGETSTGLGLTLAKRAAQNEHGDLTVSNSKEGALAVFTLPLAKLTPDKSLSLAQDPQTFSASSDRFSTIYVGLSDLL